MFVAIANDGTMFVEGREVDNWEALPNDIIIASVTLTDGISMQSTISGFDRYVVGYVGNGAVAVSGLGGSFAPVGDPRFNMHQKQVAFGIRDISRAVRNVQKVGAELDNNLASSSVTDPEFLSMREYVRPKISAAVDRIVARLSENACVKIELAPTQTFGGVSMCDISSNAFRGGAQDDSDILSVENMLKQIKKEMD